MKTRSDKMDLTGQRYGRLVVLHEVPKTGVNSRWLCRCDCGNEKSIIGHSLRIGATRSCGCLNAERRAETCTKHGMSKYSGYGSWKAMVSRCTNVDDKDYASYGGRGIVVCDRWMDVRNFAADMGEKRRGQSIDRIDPNGNYHPDNCRWTTPMGQGQHKRNNRMITVFGQTMTVSIAARKFKKSWCGIDSRLKAGMSVEDAVTEPSRNAEVMLAVRGATLSVTEWAKRTGIKAATIHARLRHGKTPEQALAAVDRTKGRWA